MCEVWHTLLLIDSDRLAMLVDEFADYGGLISAPEIASRRFGAKLAIDKNFKEILNLKMLLLGLIWTATKMGEVAFWRIGAKACVRLCCEIKRGIFQVHLYCNEIYRTKTNNIKVSSASWHRDQSLDNDWCAGHTSRCCNFSLVRNNPERLVGALSSLARPKRSNFSF